MDREGVTYQAPFHSYIVEVKPNLCFVLMPFLPEMDEIYEAVVRPAIVEPPVNMSCLRADELYTTNEIVEDIWSSILSARVIVADLTHRNPNVMYELGMVHTLGKRAVLLTQDIDDVPFDLRHIRCIVYDRGPLGVAKLKGGLQRTLESLLAEPIDNAY